MANTDAIPGYNDLFYAVLDNYTKNGVEDLFNLPKKYIQAISQYDGKWITKGQPIPKRPLRITPNGVIPFSGYQTYALKAQNQIITTQQPLVSLISVNGISQDEIQIDRGETARVDLIDERIRALATDMQNQENRSLIGGGGSGTTFPGLAYWLRTNQASITSPIGGINRSLYPKLRDQEAQNIASTDILPQLFQIRNRSQINGKNIEFVVIGESVNNLLYAQQGANGTNQARIVKNPSGSMQEVNYEATFRFGDMDFVYDPENALSPSIAFGMAMKSWEWFNWTMPDNETERKMDRLVMGKDKPANQKAFAFSSRMTYGALCFDPQSNFIIQFAI